MSTSIESPGAGHTSLLMRRLAKKTGKDFAERLILPMSVREIEFSLPPIVSPLTVANTRSRTASDSSTSTGSDDESITRFRPQRSFKVPSYTKNLPKSCPPADRVKNKGPHRCNSVTRSQSPTQISTPTLPSPRCHLLGQVNPDLYPSISTLFLDESGSPFPYTHIGRLWFSLDYNESSRMLFVYLIRVENLPKRKDLGLKFDEPCDPVVRIEIISEEGPLCETSSLQTKTCDPIFNEEFTFKVTNDKLQVATLNFHIFDSKGTKEENLQVIGHVSVPLRTAVFDNQILSADLLPGNAKDSYRGELEIALCFLPVPRKRLMVTIIQGKMSSVSDRSQDTYVLVQLIYQSEIIKTKRTSIVKSSENPRYIERHEFKIDKHDIEDLFLAVYVIDSNTKGIIGKLTIGGKSYAQGKAYHHWNLMINNPKERIQQWHLLQPYD
ncbi:synaptotagmin-15-like [Artemia franciscana]